MRIPSAPLAVASLIGGYAVAASTGNRPLGGAVLAVGGAACAWLWYRRSGPVTTAVLLTTYAAAFAVSHPLAKQLGAWPSVLTVSAATGATALALSDLRSPAQLPAPASAA